MSTLKFKILLLFCFSSLLFQAQQADSLLNEYKSYPDDTSKVNLLYTKGFDCRNNDLKSAVKFAQACYQTAVAVKSSHFIAKALNLRAVIKAQMGMNKEAIDDFERALLLRIKTKDTLSQAIILNNLANIYSTINDDANAYTCYEKSLELASKVEDDYWVRGAILGIGSLQVKKKMYQQAEGNFETLVQFGEQKYDYDLLLECYKNIGICKLNLGDTLAAESYQLMVLDITQMTDDEIGQADAYNYLGQIYMSKKNYKESLSCLENALAISRRNDYSEGLLTSWKNLSDYYKEIKNSDEALYYLAIDRKSTRLNSSHIQKSRMPSSA